MSDPVSDERTFTHPARVLAVQPGDADRLTALLRDQHVYDPSILDERTPFFWPAEISSNRLDAYFTRMAPSSLRNYAADAAAGVAFQNSHNQWQLGFGRSLTGRYEETADLARVLAEFYTFPGLRLHEVSTDDFILGVRSGLIKDVSIGFYGGSFRCAICGRDMLDWECPHIPGIRYPTHDAAGNVTGEELAFAWVDDAHLCEVSAVYDGATPGAAILKAQQEADGGRLRPETARLLEARYRIRLPGAARQWSGVSGEPSVRLEGRTMDAVVIEPEAASEAEPVAEAVQPAGDAEAEAVVVDAGAVAELRALYEGQQAHTRAVAELLGVPEGGDLGTAVRALRAELTRLQPFETRAVTAERRVVELEPLAQDGRAYRADLLAETLAEGVRAYGDRFEAETYRPLLEAAPLATVKRMRDDWRAVGEQLFKGGRLTVDKAAPFVQKHNGTPDAAFMG